MRREEDMPFNRMVWSKSGRAVGRIFLEHALMMSEILVGVTSACEKSGGVVRYYSAEELAPLPNRTTNEAGAFRWSINSGEGASDWFPMPFLYWSMRVAARNLSAWFVFWKQTGAQCQSDGGIPPCPVSPGSWMPTPPYGNGVILKSALEPSGWRFMR